MQQDCSRLPRLCSERIQMNEKSNEDAENTKKSEDIPIYIVSNGHSKKSASFWEKLKKIFETLFAFQNNSADYVEFTPRRRFDEWLKKTNKKITKFLTFATAITGILTWLIGMFDPDARIFDWELGPFINFWLIVPIILAVILTPKSLRLVNSLVEKGERDKMRPELLFIFRVLFGIIGFLSVVFCLYLGYLGFNGHNEDAMMLAVVLSIMIIIVTVLIILCLLYPDVIRVKPGYPTNCAEELVIILLLPMRITISLTILLTGVVFVLGILRGLTEAGKHDDLFYLLCTVIIPFALPFAAYITYLAMNFTLDLYRAITSIPRKLDELKAIMR